MAWWNVVLGIAGAALLALGCSPDRPDAADTAVPPLSAPGDGIGWFESPTSRSSYEWAWMQVELLRIADELPGGLTRPNLLLAMWAADLRPPHHLPGVRYQLDGPADPEPVETRLIDRWSVGGQEWTPRDQELERR